MTLLLPTLKRAFNTYHLKIVCIVLETKRLIVQELDICFTQFIVRDFPHELIQEDCDEFLNRVINPIYPDDEEERRFNTHIKARA